MESKEEKRQEFRKWIKQNGGVVCPGIKILQDFNGIQGIGTSKDLPHKKLILAIPSKLVLSIKRCYNDPYLKKLFRSNDDLFDYEGDEEGQFNVFTVFLMYHYMKIEASFWRPYLETMQKPSSLIIWDNQDLYGLNRSVIEETLHVRKQCEQLQGTLCKFLKQSKQFGHLQLSIIKELFQKCYPLVLTRALKFYYDTACLVPVIDLFNHSCQTINHQLIHTGLEKQLIPYNYKKKNKLFDCSLLNLKKQKQKYSLPFRLKFLVQNNLIQQNSEKLKTLKRNDIDQIVYDFNSKFLQSELYELQKLDFSQENDEQDNDTDEEEYFQSKQSMKQMKKQEEQQMVEFQKHYVYVQKLVDVEKRMQDEKNKQKAKQLQKRQQEEKTNKKEQEEEEMKEKVEQPQKPNTKTMPESIKNNICPIQYVPSDSDNSDDQEQDERMLEQGSYFGINTQGPVKAGQELFISYGSRTNRFLMIWYGFCYPQNQFDSVNLRLHVVFSQKRPQASTIALDSHVGGKGMAFKKANKEKVNPEEVSRQFRLKRHRMQLNFIIFLRLFLLNYYKGADLYKIFATLPSSLQFEEYMLLYLRDIVESLNERYPLDVIQNLKVIKQHSQKEEQKTRAHFKIIYLEQQRKIIDENLKGIDIAIKIVRKLKTQEKFNDSVYKSEDIKMIRFLRKYLEEIKKNYVYIKYEQKQKEQ